MSDIRENLKPLLNKRVRVRGVFAKWDDHWVSHQKQVGRVCITQPEIDGEVVARYVWVVGVPHWKQYRDALGSQVIFEAVVQRYTTRCNETNYCLGNADDLTILHLPALAIPDPPQEDDMADKWEEPEPIPAPEPQSKQIETIRQITAWAKTNGGFDLVEKVLVTMPSMPVPELLAYIRAMKE